MPARASVDSAASARAIPVNLSPLISAYRKRGRFTLRVENLPQSARFSAGQNNGDGTWSLALDELDDLVYFAPKSTAAGDHTLSIRLIAKNETEAFTLALIDFPIIGISDREGAGFPKPVAHGAAQEQLEQELHQLRTQLAARDAELNQLRASAERMGVLLQQRLDQAVADAQAQWKRDEATRLQAEKARLEEQFEHRQTERESRAQAIAEIGREQQAQQMRRLAQEFGTAQETLAARDGELAASRAALERARKDVEKEIALARQTAQAKAAESLKAAEAEWQAKAGKVLAEMTARRDQAEAALAKLRAAADNSGELRELRAELERLRQKAETDTAQAKAASEPRIAELAKLGEQLRAQLTEMTGRAESAEADLQAARSAAAAAAPEREAELNRMRADLERQRFELEMEMVSAKVALEAKSQDALKLAHGEWQAAADKTVAELTARAERAEAALASAPSGDDHEIALNQLRMELEHQRMKAQGEVALLQVAAAEAAAARADLMARAERAEKALADARAAAPDQEIAANQLRMELEHQRVKAQGEIAAAHAARETRMAEAGAALAEWKARAEGAEAALADARAAQPDRERAANQLLLELEQQRVKAQSEIAVANAARDAKAAEAASLKAAHTQREAEMNQLRAEFEQKAKAAEAEIAAVKASSERDGTEKLKRAEDRWEKEKAEILAEVAARTEAAEAALARARRLDAAKVDDDAYVHSLEREVKTLRATLADREISIVQTQAMQEHMRLGTVRETPGARWQPLMSQAGEDGEEKSETAKSNRQLLRDVSIVVAVAAAAVLLFPRLEAMLPDTLRWQVETLGGLFAPQQVEVAAPAPPPAAAAVQPKAEHPMMYVSRAVNVRAEPSVSAPVAANLKRGAQVAVLEKRGNWDQVEIARPAGAQPQTPAQQGWIYNSYLTDTDPGASN